MTSSVTDKELDAFKQLAAATDEFEQYRSPHATRIAQLADEIAQRFLLASRDRKSLRVAALLHDLGEAAMERDYIQRAGELTSEERIDLARHPVIGEQEAARAGADRATNLLVRWHHEWWNGGGYPDGLRGDEIPITARILTIADSFDSMREDRQYRKAMTRDEAIAVLKEGAGSVFDPNIVRAFLDSLEEFEAEIRERRVEPQVEAFRRKTGGDDRLLERESGPIAYEKIRSAHREVLALYNIAQTIGASLDLRDTFAVFSARLFDIVSYTTCVLYLARQDATEVEAVHVAVRHTDSFRGKRMRLGAGISGWVVANSHPMHNCDPIVDFGAMQIDPGEFYSAATVVPLVKEGEAHGALALYSTELEAYTPDHLRLMEAVAKLLSDAVANAVHHERAETSALTDVLTGLPNARALRYRFEDEADRARRHRDGFSVMMMDLDGFKSVNDRFGHQAGDQVLGELARLLLSQVRSSDFISRYAGDEFVGIMQVGPEEAIELVHRIQRAVERHEFGFNGSKMSIGVSIGWACFGTDGDTLDELLLAADRAMYADKGKRKAMVAESSTFNTDDLGQYKIM